MIYSAIAYEDEQQILALEADHYIAKGSKNYIKDHIRHVLDRFAGGKRREEVIHGKSNLQPRSITQKLLLVRRHYHVMMENLAEAVIEMDCTGRIVHANMAAQELLRRELPNILSSRLTDHIAGAEFTQVEQWFAHVASGE